MSVQQIGQWNGGCRPPSWWTNGRWPVGRVGLATAVAIAGIGLAGAFWASGRKGPAVASPSAEVQAALARLFPQADSLGPPLKASRRVRQVQFYPALRQGKTIGLVAAGSSLNGYGGRLEVVLGMSPDGRIDQVVVAAHRETAGIGTRATGLRPGEEASLDRQAMIVESGQSTNRLLASFQGRLAADAPWRIDLDGGEIDSISGATVTCVAITAAVNQIATTFRQQPSGR